MSSLVHRPLPGCLGIVLEVVLMFVVAGVINLVFASRELTGFVMLAFFVRWIYAVVSSPALPGPPGSTMLIDPWEHRDDDAQADAGGGSDADGDAGSD